MPAATVHSRRQTNKESSGLLRSAVTAVAASLVLGLGLWALSWYFGRMGGIADYPSALRFEVPFLLALFLGLTFLLRPGPWRAVIAAAPIVAFYLATDLHYVLLHNVFKLDDILLIPEALSVASDWVPIALGIAITAWLGAFLYYLKRGGRELIAPLALLSLAAALPATAYVVPGRFLETAQRAGFSVIEWSDRYTSAVMGRSASVLLFAASRQKALDELAHQPILSDPGRDPGLIDDLLQTGRNVHILVLESLLDPVRFSALDFGSPTEPARFDTLRRNMRVAKAPVFGGGTAQVEFEVLCGAPSLELYSSAEFNMMSGEPTPCLPTLLADAGYRTIATQPYKPDFFNSEKAYKSLGFQEINFPTVYAGIRDTYLQYELEDSYIFDGDLFEQNLAYVKQQIAAGQPFLNYVLGIYGHLPHEIDVSRHPDAVEIEGLDPDSQAYRAIQQFYYRAGALADHVLALREIDPDGLILVTSDHLPPLDAGLVTYDALGYELGEQGEYYENIWFFDGPAVSDSTWPDRQYEFMDFILDALTDGRYCIHAQCKNRVEWETAELTASYRQLIALGAGAARSVESGSSAAPSPVTASTSPPGTLKPGT